VERPETLIGAEGGAPPGRPGSLEDLRGRNVVRIVRALRDAGQASRADIARTTGISRTTVSGAIADLVRGGWVREVGGAGAPTSQGGRPPLLVALEPLAGLAVGIDFDHDRLRVAVADLERRVRAGHEIELDVDGDGERALDVAAELARDAVRRTGVGPERVIGVGLSVPAPVAPASGIILEPEILPGWASLDPAAEMAARLSWPVQADNDANLGALAEATWGAARGARECLFVQLRAGIGAGLLLRGEIYRGATGAAGELGHVTVDDGGPLCGCGNRGCLQSVASEPAILDLLRRAGRAERTITEVVDAAQAGDRLCRRVLEDAGRHIGRALAMACNVLNPERVVIGSDMRLAGDLLLEPAREELRRRVLGATEAAVELVAGELGSAAAVQGALALVLLATEEHIAARVPRGSAG
jgi:predicted NBD/HSP70 family sugar kinase